MELSACDEVVTLVDMPNGAIITNPIDSVTYSCLQRIASQASHLMTNQTVLQYPPDVGLPINTKTKFLLRVEYTNDLNMVQDDSGFDLFVSDEPMSNSIGIMAVGLYPDVRLFIPPNVTQWNTKGTCYSSCFDNVSNIS